MDISDEDADELLTGLWENGFCMPMNAANVPHGREAISADELVQNANRDALRRAIEDTKAWARYRIY